METPIQTTESAIENEKLWACIKVALISLIWIPLTAAGTFILVDYKIMNKPIIEYVREVTVIEQSHPTNIFDTKGKWISQGDPIKLTPEKEIKK